MNVSEASAAAAASATPALDQGGESAPGANAALLALGGVPPEPLVVYVLAFAAVVTVIAVACILYRECAPSRAKPAEEPTTRPPPLTRPPSLLAALATGRRASLFTGLPPTLTDEEQAGPPSEAPGLPLLSALATGRRASMASSSAPVAPADFAHAWKAADPVSDDDDDGGVNGGEVEPGESVCDICVWRARRVS